VSHKQKGFLLFVPFLIRKPRRNAKAIIKNKRGSNNPNGE